MLHQNSPSDPIYRIAVRAREETRQLLKDNPGIFDGDPKDLCAACSIASYILCAALKRANIKSQFVVGRGFAPNYPCDNHAWTQLPDGTIIDITATQFGISPRKVFFSPKDPNYIPSKKRIKAIENLHTWPVAQNPLKHRPLLLPVISSLTRPEIECSRGSLKQ